jgi:hypothetical protein
MLRYGVADPCGRSKRPKLNTTSRIGYFTDGVILGSQSFVESHFYNLQKKLAYRRRRTGTPITALGCSDTLWVFRDLRVRPTG